jgi:hypothetical protein
MLCGQNVRTPDRQTVCPKHCLEVTTTTEEEEITAATTTAALWWHPPPTILITILITTPTAIFLEAHIIHAAAGSVTVTVTVTVLLLLHHSIFHTAAALRYFWEFAWRRRSVEDRM